jgi:hypothetical protein
VNANPADHLAGSAGSAYSPLAPSEEPAEQRDPPEHPMESGILRNARLMSSGFVAIPSAHSFTIAPPWTRAIVIAARRGRTGSGSSAIGIPAPSSFPGSISPNNESGIHLERLGPELPLTCHRAPLTGLRRTLSLRSRRLRVDAAALFQSLRLRLSMRFSG